MAFFMHPPAPTGVQIAMDIKSHIISILSKEHYTFAQLASYLQKTEESLSNELSNKTLELRNLEAIAKALRVPLYSLFSAETPMPELSRHPYHMSRIWTGNDEQKEINQLREEIALFKEIIALKEAQILRRTA